jgi:hypothetical protein
MAFAIAGLVAAAVGCDDGKKKSEQEEFSCPHGENPDGNGCLLPCEDGWHEGPDGTCAVDCPHPSTAGEDGFCAIPGCPDGWSSIEISVEDLVTHTCYRECPGAMDWESSVTWSCAYPCPAGWTLGDDVECHLDCPEGMVATDEGAGCDLPDAGEAKTCPGTPWDTSISGPSPIYVDGTSGSDTGDGTEGAPFATIGAALASTTADSVTIYLAAGTYDEHVHVSDKTELNLIGACADQVLIAPATIPELPEDITEGAVQLDDVDSARIHGVEISSPKNALRIEHTGDAGSIIVDQVEISAAGHAGIAIWGEYASTLVEHNTITGAVWGMHCAMGEAVVAEGELTIRDNLVYGLVPPEDSDVSAAEGIVATSMATIEISGNAVRDFSEALGITVQHTTGGSITGNIVSGLSGFAAVWAAPTVSGEQVTLTDIIIDDIAAEPTGYDPSGQGASGVLVYGFGLSTTRMIHNRVSRVQGIGVSVMQEADDELEIRDCELASSSVGAIVYGGEALITDNRFLDTWSALHLRDEAMDANALGPVTVEGNTFTDRAASDFDLPEGPLKNLLALDIYSGVLSAELPVIFRRNTYHDIASPSASTPYVLMASVSNEIQIVENAFSHNEGNIVSLDGGTVTVADNLFALTGTAIEVVASSSGQLASLEIAGNAVLGSEIYAAWEVADLELVLRDNYVTASTAVIGYPELGIPAGPLSLRGNAVVSTNFTVGLSDDLRIEENYFDIAVLEVIEQLPGSQTAVLANALVSTSIVLNRITGPAMVRDNGVHGGHSLPLGLGIFASPGPVVVDHNIFSAPVELAFPGVGDLGDGIHVVGDASGAASDVELTANIVSASPRLGIVLDHATGRVEGNMYLDNGCGGDCDLVVQSPSGEGVDGWDTGFAVTPDDPYGVIPPEDATAY